MVWAMKQDIVTAPTPRHVLLCLANYAGEDGVGAFPSIARLARDTGLSERAVQQNLAKLAEAGVIVAGNQALAAARIDRTDRRPNVWNIDMDATGRQGTQRGEPAAPRRVNGVNLVQNGVNLATERGEPAAPDPSINPTASVKEQEHVQPAAARSRFADFWAAYPNKKSRQEAEKAWRRLKLDDRCDELIAHIALMQSSDDGWRRGYIPMGSTYLNQARWEDVPTRPARDGPAPVQSKTLTAIQTLQAMKHGNLDSRRDSGRPEQAALPVAGAITGR